MKGQKEAIEKVSGPCVILAGAGTGKTYTIVEKIKYLIRNKIYSPEKIVCITFSNEAANNLVSRVNRNFNFAENKSPVIKTFHAFSAELLRKYGNKIGIKNDFNILTPDDAKVVLHRYLKVPAGNCHKYISSIGTAKDLGISIESLKEYLNINLDEFKDIDLEKRLEDLQFNLKTLYLRRDKIGKGEILSQINRINGLLNLKKFINSWNAYEKLKNIKNYQDYSDLNKNALKLLREHKEICSDYDYIIVDEFQDTNKVQLELLSFLAQHNNISVVGDLNQSIYRFRGAYRKNFNEFKDRFNVSEKDIFNLDRSYRSPNRVLKAAHKLISNNYSSKEECFMVLNKNDRIGDKIEVYELKNAKEEARKVVELIRKEIEDKIEVNEICVMFRTHQQGRIIRRALELEEIPFVSVSKNSLLKERSIRTVIDYLSILNKLKNKESGGDDSWWDLIYQLRFAEEDLIKIGRFIKDNKKGDINELMLSSLPEIGLSDSGRTNAKILIEKIRILMKESSKDVPELVKYVYNIASLVNHEKTKKDKAAMLNLNRFYDLAKEHCFMHAPDLGSFIYYLNIINSLNIEVKAADSEDNGVRLMTLHATKGLEYNTVIITNLSQKRFPLDSHANNSLIPLELSPEFSFDVSDEFLIQEYEKQNQLFEERRLCYVAFTRAKSKLILTHADEYSGRKYFPSQFLHEVDYKNNSDFSFFLDIDEKYSDFADKNDETEVLQVEHKKDFKELVLSPSSLLSFVECQKKYEYKYVYNMPDQKVISWEAIMLGSFVHRILDSGVKLGFRDLKNFEDLARETKLESDWESVDLTEALHLVRVFFERNKSKYNSNSVTEQLLKMQIGGINFIGFADRMDFNNDGIEIIDYKTGNSNVPTRSRDWQLGYYALAASQFGKVRRVTLDMLRHDKPLEFEINSEGEAVAVNSDRIKGFNIYNVEQELVKIAHEIIDAYKNGFKPCSVEKNCEFCGEYVYGL